MNGILYLFANSWKSVPLPGDQGGAIMVMPELSDAVIPEETGKNNAENGRGNYPTVIEMNYFSFLQQICKLPGS